MGQRPILVVWVGKRISIGLALTGAHEPAKAREALGQLVHAAVTAERAGLDSVWIGDHVSAAGEPWFDNRAVVAVLAEQTRRIGLGIIIIAPLRHPVALANELATLDVISGGRLSYCLVAGWQQEEFALLGVPFSGRTLAVIRAQEVVASLWRGEPMTVAGRRFGSVNPGRVVPAWLGGSGDVIARAAARLGAGFLQSSHVGTSSLSERGRQYRAAVPDGQTPRLGAIRQVFVGESDETAWAAARTPLKRYYQMYRNWGLGTEAGFAGANMLAPDLSERFIIGSAATVAQRLADLEATTATATVICRMGWPGLQAHAFDDSIRRLGTDVRTLLDRDVAFA